MFLYFSNLTKIILDDLRLNFSHLNSSSDIIFKSLHKNFKT